MAKKTEKPEVTQPPIVIEWRDPKSLKPYKNNSKLHPAGQIQEIAEKIEKFGFDVPIVIDTKGVIIKGHGRREAACKLKLIKVPVIVRDIDPALARAARIADNKVAESPWDLGMLRKEFGDLREIGMDLQLTGFDPSEIAAITEGWSSDLSEVLKHAPNSDGIISVIKISCHRDDHEKLKGFLTAAIQKSKFKGVQVE